MLGALKHRNFRLFFFGQSISLIGTWMQQVAMMWLVYRLTNSAFLLGLVGFSSQIPSFFLAPLAGVFADRWNLHRTIIATQTLSMLQAAILAALTMSGVVTVWQVLLLGVFLGLINAFDIPARQAFLIQMVEGREGLAAAIGLNSSMFNAAQFVGGAIGGLLIKAMGEATCFQLNALSYLAVLAALLAMRLAPRPPAKPPQRFLHEFREGFRYAFGFRPIRDILLLLTVMNLVAMPLRVLLPVFATTVFQGRAGTLGLLTAALGMGALVGGLLLASRKTVLGLGRQIAWAGGAFGLTLIAFSLSSVLWLSLLILVGSGLMVMTHMASSNTVVQTIVDDDKRGRVMSFYTMTFLGVAPLGSLIAGALADRIGAARVVQIGGALCMAASLLFAYRLPAMRKLVHPIYQRIGVLPDVTSGVPAETDLAIVEDGG